MLAKYTGMARRPGVRQTAAVSGLTMIWRNIRLSFL